MNVTISRPITITVEHAKDNSVIVWGVRIALVVSVHAHLVRPTALRLKIVKISRPIGRTVEHAPMVVLINRFALQVIVSLLHAHLISPHAVENAAPREMFVPRLAHAFRLPTFRPPNLQRSTPVHLVRPAVRPVVQQDRCALEVPVSHPRLKTAEAPASLPAQPVKPTAVGIVLIPIMIFTTVDHADINVRIGLGVAMEVSVGAWMVHTHAGLMAVRKMVLPAPRVLSVSIRSGQLRRKMDDTLIEPTNRRGSCGAFMNKRRRCGVANSASQRGLIKLSRIEPYDWLLPASKEKITRGVFTHIFYAISPRLNFLFSNSGFT